MSGLFGLVILALAATGASALLAGDRLLGVGFTGVQLSNLADFVFAAAAESVTAP
jgi:hypothetical protein